MLALVASTASAQCGDGGPPAPPAVRRAIVGVVMDAQRAPLANVDVVVRDPRRQTRSNGDGVFRLDSLPPGKHEVIARRIGYALDVQTVTVTEDGGVARFCLAEEARALAPVITSASRGGLSGVVGDTGYKVIAGAEVRVMGQGLWALTDSAGEFHFPLKKGRYAVVVKKKGYSQQLAAVTVPEDSGRRILVWLGPPMRNTNAMAAAFDDMRERIMRTPSHRYHMITAEDLGKTSMSTAQAAQVLGRTPMADDCPVILAGSGGILPLYMIDKADVLMMEVVGAPLSRRRGGAMSKCAGQVLAWMKP